MQKVRGSVFVKVLDLQEKQHKVARSPVCVYPHSLDQLFFQADSFLQLEIVFDNGLAKTQPSLNCGPLL